MLVEKLSEQFRVACLQKDNQSVCSFPPDHGSGYIRSSLFPNGIKIIEIKGSLVRPMQIPVKSGGKFLLRMIFNMRWSANYTDSQGEFHSLGQFDSILNTQQPDQECSFDLETEKPIFLFMVELDVENFKKKFTGIEFSEENQIMDLLNGFKDKGFYVSKNRYTLSLHHLILKFNDTSYEGNMRYVYQEAKATEIIIERFKQLLDDRGDGQQSMERQIKLDSVEEAAMYISERLDNLETIKEIAKRVGISQQALQEGFKQQFGCTVNQFVADLRLNRAIELLDNSELNISEITYRLGLNSKSYFSKIFKEKFGIGPNEYKKLLRQDSKRDFKRSG